MSVPSNSPPGADTGVPDCLAEFVDQLSRPDLQRPRNFQNIQQRHVPPSAFDLRDVIPVQICDFRQVFLTQLSFRSQFSHSRSKLKQGIFHTAMVAELPTISPYTMVWNTIV